MIHSDNVTQLLSDSIELMRLKEVLRAAAIGGWSSPAGQELNAYMVKLMDSPGKLNAVVPTSPGEALTPFQKRAADALADEAAALIRRRVIGQDSPLGDALIDYRMPPTTPRSERIAQLENELAQEHARGVRNRREARLAQAELTDLLERRAVKT